MVGELIDIATVKRNLVFRIREFRALGRPGAPDNVYCDELCRLSVHHRQLGICLLLHDLDWPGFRKELAQSAEARIDLLEWTGNAQAALHQFTCVGRSAPFFDAIASSRLDLAKRIAELSHSPYAEDYEYEDDRAWGLFTHALVATDLQPSPRQRLFLDDFLRATEGKGGARYAIGEALMERDARELASGLRELSDEHAEAYEEEVKGPIFDHFRFRTEQFVSVEGIALRSLAEAIGMKVEGAIRFMPSEGD